jgi:hypothetical protein
VYTRRWKTAMGELSMPKPNFCEEWELWLPLEEKQ